MSAFVSSLLCIILFVCGFVANGEAGNSGLKPYKRADQQLRGYFGPGREDPEPTNLKEIRIGYFGPDDPTHPQGGMAWAGAKLAVEEANAKGGTKGLPFRLVPGWSENPWAGGISSVTKMAYVDRVWAVIGSINGHATHLAEQVVAKARLVLIDPMSTDETVNLANVAWAFSVLPGDAAATALIGQNLIKTVGNSFVLLSSTDHDSRMMCREFKEFLGGQRICPFRAIEFDAGVFRKETVTAQLLDASIKAAVVLADASDSALVIKEIRKIRPKMLVFGGPAMATALFQKSAGDAAQGVRFPLVIEQAKPLEAFEKRFLNKYGFPPDYGAASAYDSVFLLTSAINHGGLNRVRILDVLEALSPFQGVSGRIEWDKTTGRNIRPPQLAIIQDGKIVPLKK